MKDLIDKYKKLILKRTNEENDEVDVKVQNNKQKRNIENIAIFIVILVITVMIINTILKGDNKRNKSSSEYKQLVDNKDKSDSVTVANMDINTDLENNLEEILKKMQGVGNVKVLVTYSQTSQIVPIYNQSNKNSVSTEKDSEGRY